MATTQRVDIDVVVKNTQRIEALEKALNRTQKSAITLGSAAKIAGSAIAAIGVGRSLKSLITVGNEVESLSLRFKFLFGSVQEGSKAFDTLTTFASKVPFSLGEISRASGNLAVVSKDATELGDVLRITGNVAAVTGLDFQTTASQIQRAFAGGIASADIFREKGVRSLLGFKEGATATAEETRAAFARVFGQGGQFGQATDDFAQTLEGTLSMLGDKLFKFQSVASSALFEYLKEELGDLNRFFEDNQDVIDEYAEKLGRGLGEAVMTAGRVMKFLAENTDLVRDAMIFLISLQVAAWFYGITTAIRGATISMAALNAAINKNKFVILGTVIAQLVTYFGLKKLATEEDTKATEENNKKTYEAYELYEQFGPTISENTRLRNLESFVLSGQVGVYDDMTSAQQVEINNREYLNRLLQENRINYENLKGASKSFVESVMQYGETEHQEIMRREKEEIARAEAMYKNEEINKRELEDLKTRIQEEYMRRRVKLAEQEQKELDDRHKSNLEKIKQGKFEEINIEEMTGEQRKKIVAETGLSILKSLGSFNKEAFMAYKAVEIAKAVIAGKQSVLQSYKTGSAIGGPIIGGVFAAAAAAYTLSQINAIRSMPFPGRKRGGMIASGKTYLTGEDGPELITAGSNGYVTPNNMLGGGSVTVNFNINAVDSSSFDQLLQQRRDTIVGVINQAMNEKGKRSLTS